MIIKSVGVMSVARVAAAIYGVFGLIAGVVFSLAAVTGAGLDREVGAQVSWLGPMFGLGAIIALPVLYYVLGFVGGAIGAWVFNNVSRATGGVQVEVEESK